MVHILQPEAIDLLAQMEGAQWRRTQEQRQEAPYGFFFWLRAFQAKIAAGLRDVPVSLCSFGDRATRAPVLYGEEGYRRYVVDVDGEVALIRETALPHDVERAEALGFRLA